MESPTRSPPSDKDVNELITSFESSIITGLSSTINPSRSYHGTSSKPNVALKNVALKPVHGLIQSNILAANDDESPVPVLGIATIVPKETYEDTDAAALLLQQCRSIMTPAEIQKFAEIKEVSPSCIVYKDIFDYVRNSCNGIPIKIKRIYRINRHSDKFPVITESFRIMLWHGTSPKAIPSIIETGFRKGRAGLFGGGIYFADRIAKSWKYKESEKGSGSGFMVLAEVLPGRMYKAHHFHQEYKKPPKGFDSVKGNGSDIPKWKDNRTCHGAIMPCGETVPNMRHLKYDMQYNEYILYDMNRVLVRYVVEVHDE